ncbi:MAG: homoserine dehydrogenase [Candidatus Methanomethylophilus sp.]|nr:homoserine dehydrogenase [Methanomethylophilus sp.]MBQ4411496.1 homoserine dehydrogenase [Methanomethylophilus sp.]
MRVFLSGFGTVGQGFAEVIKRRRDFFEDKYGEQPVVVGVIDSKTFAVDQKGLDLDRLVARKQEKKGVSDETYADPLAVMDSVNYDLLIEVSPTDVETGGTGLKTIRHALECGKDVITVNKGPLALHFHDLIALAKKNGCKFRFEGSVGGAMPIINLCHENLKGEKISSIRGIFNGTCNYILSKMDNGQPFEQALKEAQQLGYAETDPTNDVEGYDAATKVVILANSVFHRDVSFKDVKITGITGITPDAIAQAKSHNMVIRLVGEITETRLEVAPRLIPIGHPLSISGTLNIAQIDADLAGPITITGRGAGKIETASAILSDLIAIMSMRL